MPAGVEVSIEDDTATVVFLKRDLWRVGVGRLLDAAGDPQLVRKVTFPEVAYIVPVWVARAAGFVDEPPTDHTGATLADGALPTGDFAPAHPPNAPDMSWSRPELNVYATNLGVLDAEKLPRKQDVLAAINEAITEEAPA